MNIIIITLLIALQTPLARDAEGPRKTLSVCEILADDPTKLNGAVVTVRGYLSATDHGTWLNADCKKHLVTKGLAWPDQLSVYVDASSDRIARSWEQVSHQSSRLGAVPGRDRIWLTITGKLETRESMDNEVVQMPYGLARAGFGQTGESPAEIRVISAQDIRIERHSNDGGRHSQE